LANDWTGARGSKLESSRAFLMPRDYLARVDRSVRSSASGVSGVTRWIMHSPYWVKAPPGIGSVSLWEFQTRPVAPLECDGQHLKKYMCAYAYFRHISLPFSLVLL
jgi:hypothetical protein